MIEPISVTDKGVEYFTDINCCWKKYHKDGLKNIYSVVVSYLDESSKKNCVHTFTYDSFNMAYKRFMYEDSRKKISANEIFISFTLYTVDGTKILLIDDLMFS